MTIRNADGVKLKDFIRDCVLAGHDDATMIAHGFGAPVKIETVRSLASTFRCDMRREMARRLLRGLGRAIPLTKPVRK